MNIDGKAYRTIWRAEDGVQIIDQTRLPHELVIVTLRDIDDVARAIRDMQVRGAPLIGGTAAYGMAVAAAVDPSDIALAEAHEILATTRPTAVNLAWALQEMRDRLAPLPEDSRAEVAWRHAATICDDDVVSCRSIGEYGLAVLREIVEKKPAGEPLNILTHCNAGWLATIDWGTATAPIYAAHEAGLDVHVWVDETRPRNQGASLTAFELGQHGVPHTVIVDNVGGHLMQHGQVDAVIVGSDRTTGSGDVANKIGTYLKALAARDNGVPFYAALHSTTIDWTLSDGVAEIPIEQRDDEEVACIHGRASDGSITRVRVVPDGSPVANYAFDVTPARLVDGLITERGVCEASSVGLGVLYPEQVA